MSDGLNRRTYAECYVRRLETVGHMLNVMSDGFKPSDVVAVGPGSG
jgi:hypothetical protein